MVPANCTCLWETDKGAARRPGGGHCSMEEGDDGAKPEPAKPEAVAWRTAGGAASIRGLAGGGKGNDTSSDGR